MKPYTHPGEPSYVMRRYRQYILNTKAAANKDRLSQGKPPARRIARALVHYRAYVEEYLAAKRLVIGKLSTEALRDSAP